MLYGKKLVVCYDANKVQWSKHTLLSDQNPIQNHLKVKHVSLLSRETTWNMLHLQNNLAKSISFLTAIFYYYGFTFGPFCGQWKLSCAESQGIISKLQTEYQILSCYINT